MNACLTNCDVCGVLITEGHTSGTVTFISDSLKESRRVYDLCGRCLPNLRGPLEASADENATALTKAREG